jgi:hypothetical protein
VFFLITRTVSAQYGKAVAHSLFQNFTMGQFPEHISLPPPIMNDPIARQDREEMTATLFHAFAVSSRTAATNSLATHANNIRSTFVHNLKDHVRRWLLQGAPATAWTQYLAATAGTDESDPAHIQYHSISLVS